MHAATQTDAVAPAAPANVIRAASKPGKPGLQSRGSSAPLKVDRSLRLAPRAFDKIVHKGSPVATELITTPDGVFHGKRSSEKREAEHHHQFSLRVVFDPLTSGLEGECQFKPKIGQVIGGRYMIVRYVGSGTFSTVIECEDLHAAEADQHRFVCVKIANTGPKNNKDIFDQNLWEVKLLKMLCEWMGNDQEASGLLPALLDVFYYRETLFAVFELLRDNLYTIYKYVAEKELPIYFTPARCREVARQVLLTLKAIHAHNIVHADLKPENILIESLAACRVKVIDYGSAFVVGDCRSSYIQSRAYRAPEVILGANSSTKIDVWSLGVILVELLTGTMIFDNRSDKALLASHIGFRGAMPRSVLRKGKLTNYYFNERDEPTLFIYETGTNCVVRLAPHRGASIERVLEDHGIDDPQLASFLCDLLTLDPELRPSAAAALEHPWLAQGAPWWAWRSSVAGAVEPYLADGFVSEETRLALRYPSLRDNDTDAEPPLYAEAPGTGAGTGSSSYVDVAGTDRGPIFDNQIFRHGPRAPASLRNSQHHVGSVRGSTERHSDGSVEDEVRGPLTPLEFRAHSEREAPAMPAPRSQERRRSMTMSRLGELISTKSKKVAKKLF